MCAVVHRRLASGFRNWEKRLMIYFNDHYLFMHGKKKNHNCLLYCDLVYCLGASFPSSEENRIYSWFVYKDTGFFAFINPCKSGIISLIISPWMSITLAVRIATVIWKVNFRANNWLTRRHLIMRWVQKK